MNEELLKAIDLRRLRSQLAIEERKLAANRGIHSLHISVVAREFELKASIEEINRQIKLLEK